MVSLFKWFPCTSRFNVIVSHLLFLISLIETLPFEYNGDDTISSKASSICLTPELDGKWILDTNKTFIDPICCEGDDRLFRFNTGLCSKKKMPTDFEGKSDILATMRGRACRCGNFTDRYTWKADALPGWDAHDFCRRLGKRTILLIGDSTVSQASTVLMNAVFLAGCQVQISYVMSDTLILESMGALNRGSYWTDAVVKRDPDIVIVAGGSHIYGARNYSRMYNSLLSDIEILRRLKKNITIVWKTQQAGGCTDDILAGHPFDAARAIPAEKHLWNHAFFFDRDLLTIQRMQEHNVPFVDLRMLYSRTDAHQSNFNDCMHFCSPGPLDIFPILLYRLLKNNFLVSPCIKLKKKGNNK